MVTRYSDSRTGTIVLMLAAVISMFLEAPAAASWFLNAEKLHVSVHGQISCVECHGAIEEAPLHPDPVMVNRTQADFFQADQCASCHGDVVAGLDRGVHAGKPIEDSREYRSCITCHDPHYQLSAKDLPIGFDRSKPVGEQCGACHEQRFALPALSSRDERCMACHRAVEAKDAQGTEKIAAFCFHCHGGPTSWQEGPILLAFPTVNATAYGASTHRRLSCVACHPNSAEFSHAGQKRTACLSCHQRHDEKVAHDAHLDISCEACHLAGIIPMRGLEPGRVLWQIDRKLDRPSDLHNMTLKHDESSCGRCHYQGNPVGAAAMVLPPKSILCMPCHAATFSIGDATTIVSVCLFLLGMASLCTVWISGRRPIAVAATDGVLADKTVNARVGMVSFSWVFRVAKNIALDVFLQRRLFRQSKKRWLIHSLIFFPFVFRFLWGITALLTSLWLPESPLPWTMLHKNDPMGAFLFDASGLMILTGINLIALRRIRGRSQDIAGLPKQDWPALFLLGGIVIIGFILEGMRIAMTGSPVGSGYAFLGYAISRFFVDNPAVSVSYGYIWYLHAILTGALVAYLPFSSLLHVIMAPVVLALKAVSTEKGKSDGVTGIQHAR